MGRFRGAPPNDAAAPGLDRRTLWTLLCGNALTGIGIGFFLPILPLFVRSRGGGAFLVGLVFAGGVVGRALAQYPAGWLADRYGRKPVIVGALLCYALIFPLYLLPMPVPLLVLLRGLHALTSGAYLPAAAAMIGDLGGQRKARAFGMLRSSDMVGLVLGPAVGGLVAGFDLEAVFWVGAAFCLLASGMMLFLPSIHGRRGARARREASASAAPFEVGKLLWRLAPFLALAMPLQWAIATYDTVWSLYLTSRGATYFEVGLSFATYGIPMIFLGSLAGTFVDRFGRLRSAIGSLAVFAVFLALYPFIRLVPLLIGLGLLEGTLTLPSGPAMLAGVSDAAPPGAQGRTQGLFQSASYGAEAVGALVAGALYGVGPGAAFGTGAGLIAVGCLVCLVLRRAQVAHTAAAA
ncbi:MAG: MFS transporter [Candidatus Dormibacteraceae bacterium]